jgi:uncharacterized membrane protein (UPF0136 family)
LAGFGFVAILFGALSALAGSFWWGLIMAVAGCGLLLGRKWGGALALVALGAAVLHAAFVPGIWIFNSIKIFVAIILAIILGLNWRLLR